MTSLFITLHHTGRILFATLFVLLFSITFATAAGLTELVPAVPKEQAPSIMKEPEQPKITIPNLITYSCC